MNPPHSSIQGLDIGALIQVAALSPPGDFMELGVYQGGSAWWLSKICRGRRGKLHLFDTFTGLPDADDIDELKGGHFSDVDFDDILKRFPDASIYKGIFPDTLPSGLNNLAFIHVDCDQYAGVKAACELLPERLVDNGVIYFDDYEFVPGAKKAVDEVLPDVIAVGAHAMWEKK